jgi:transcriptional regulator with XRE-family HTH domain
MLFSQRLRQLRERRGYSQNGLAKASGVSQAIVQRLESGVRGVDHLSIGVARRLARQLGVSLDYLVGMYEEDETEAIKGELCIPCQS